MKVSLTSDKFNEKLLELSKKYEIYGPKRFPHEGRFSDTDLIRYSIISKVEDMDFSEKSEFSPKEILLPHVETMFYFTEDSFNEPKKEIKEKLVFLRPCDLHSVKRFDEIYLNNKFSDIYYKNRRDKVKFAVVGCKDSFDSCFCVSMGTNKIDTYDIGVNIDSDSISLDITDVGLQGYFKDESKKDFSMNFVEENKIKLDIPDEVLLEDVIDLEMWREYDKRCVACGRCNFVCPTCTCTTTQDMYYSETKDVGERRRVWASCHVDGFSLMAGNHDFRTKHGDRMRFKTMHKIGDFKKRFGYHMCTGCGRCDDACPEYISFSKCVKKLSDILGGNDE